MSLVRPIFDFALLILTVIFAVIWFHSDNPSYEPIIAILGAFCMALSWFDRYKGIIFFVEHKSFTPEELIQHSEKLRSLFQEEIYRCRAEKLRKDIVIRHVKRRDKYPHDVDEKKKGISPWFKVGLMDMYHDGIRVGLQYYALKKDMKGYRVTSSEKEEESDVTALLMAEIPFSAIEAVNMDGDEYEGYPHVFCRFPFKGQPYKRLFFCEVIEQPHGHLYFKEICSYEEVKENSKSVPNYYFR